MARRRTDPTDGRRPAPAPSFRPFAEALQGVVAPPVTVEEEVADPAPEPPRPEPEDEEGAILRRSREGAVPLPARDRERVPKAKGAPSTAPPYDEDAEALATLAALVDGQEPMTWEHTDEHASWIADDADPALLPRLVGGELAWQAHLDLHGLTRDPARDTLVRFLAGARAQGHRCVLVVHGRGHHSEDARPVLKPLVQRWLRRAPLKAWVLAYATARPADGGAGAVYVLLRR